MKPISLAGIVLIVLGALALAYQGINYTHRETVLDVGPIHATADDRSTFPFRPSSGASRFWEELSAFRWHQEKS